MLRLANRDKLGDALGDAAGHTLGDVEGDALGEVEGGAMGEGECNMGGGREERTIPRAVWQKTTKKKQSK